MEKKKETAGNKLKSARQSRIIIRAEEGEAVQEEPGAGAGAVEAPEWLRFLEMMLMKPGRSVKVAAINAVPRRRRGKWRLPQSKIYDLRLYVRVCVCVANLRLNQMQMHF